GTTLLNPNATEIGIAYAYSVDSAFGGYFTVVLAAP
ncbi:MAG: CAP domain-containing protein, partial [Anaerolineae bacterium]|nr:CAP domain-containing protein [Anaerolineae bacterium]